MNTQQLVLIVTPWLLLLSTWLCFRILKKRIGVKPAYLAGFLFYWIGWCLLAPLAVLGAGNVVNLFRVSSQPVGQPAFAGIVFLALPPVMSAATIFRARRAQLTAAVLLLSALLALVNGTCEEILWRGAYLAVFPDQPFWGLIYPAVGFGLWHLAPQEVFPSTMPGGWLAFAVSAIFLGLCYGWVAWQSGSILLTTMSHILTDFFGLSEPTLLALDVFTDFTDHIAVRKILQGVKGRVEGNIEPAAQTNAEFFTFIASTLMFISGLTLLLIRRLTWQRWLAALAAGVVWLITWYAPVPWGFSVLLILLTVVVLWWGFRSRSLRAQHQVVMAI